MIPLGFCACLMHSLAPTYDDSQEVQVPLWIPEEGRGDEGTRSVDVLASFFEIKRNLDTLKKFLLSLSSSLCFLACTESQLHPGHLPNITYQANSPKSGAQGAIGQNLACMPFVSKTLWGGKTESGWREKLNLDAGRTISWANSTGGSGARLALQNRADLYTLQGSVLGPDLEEAGLWSPAVLC